jgi:transcriptional regulator with XRE-family HTH domain
MRKPRVHKSKIVERIRQKQDPLVAARNKKKLILSAIISDALEQNDWKKGELAERLDVYASEVTRWTKGSHNFTVETLSDIEEILGIKLLPDYKPKRLQPGLSCSLTVDIHNLPRQENWTEKLASAERYIADCGGMQPTEIVINQLS